MDPVELACLLDRLVVVVLDPEVISAELPPEHPTRSIETAAIARIGARLYRLFPEMISEARIGLMPIPYGQRSLRVYLRRSIS